MLGCFVQFPPRPVSNLNTQAHLLLAAALLCRSSNDRPIATRTDGKSECRVWPVNVAVLVGALVPDISLFVMFAQARLRGISDDIIWGELYYSSFWQYAAAITNSVPIYLTLAIAGYCLLTQIRSTATAILFFGLAALLHCLSDLPLHVDDGHAHFWPLTAWVYESSVSYWDSNHYANYWQPVEFLIAGIAAVALWRRFHNLSARIAVVVGLLTYPVMLVFWFYTMH